MSDSKITSKSTVAVLMSAIFWSAPGIATPALAATDPPGGNEQLLKLIDYESKANRKKDEFETTEAFQQRLAENVGRDFLVTVSLGTRSPGPLRPKAFSYDADTQMLTVTLVGDSSIGIIKIIDSMSEESKKLGPAVMLNGRYTKFTLVETQPVLQKEYSAQNAMGASTTVSVFTSTVSAVAILNLPEASNSPLATQTVKMAPDVARAISTRAQWRLLLRTAMAPGQKSIVVDDGDYLKPTIDSPIEAAVIGHTITATLMRAELIDPETDAVIAAFGPKGQLPPAIPTASKDHAALGVLLAPVTPAIAAALGLANTNGALVATVGPASAADKAGIKQGDILLNVAGKDINGPLDVGAAVATVLPGASASVTLIHQGVKTELTVTF